MVRRLAPWIALAGLFAADPAAAEPVIEPPRIKNAPTFEDLQSEYPKAAALMVMDGRGWVRCRIPVSGQPEACEVAGESPKGLGFGEAALRIVRRLAYYPQTQDGVAVALDDAVIPIRFMPPPEPPPPPPLYRATPEALRLAKTMVELGDPSGFIDFKAGARKAMGDREDLGSEVNAAALAAFDAASDRFVGAAKATAIRALAEAMSIEDLRISAAATEALAKLPFNAPEAAAAAGQAISLEFAEAYADRLIARTCGLDDCDVVGSLLTLPGLLPEGVEAPVVRLTYPGRFRPRTGPGGKIDLDMQLGGVALLCRADAAGALSDCAELSATVTGPLKDELVNRAKAHSLGPGESGRRVQMVVTTVRPPPTYPRPSPEIRAYVEMAAKPALDKLTAQVLRPGSPAASGEPAIAEVTSDLREIIISVIAGHLGPDQLRALETLDRSGLAERMSNPGGPIATFMTARMAPVMNDIVRQARADFCRTRDCRMRDAP